LISSPDPRASSRGLGPIAASAAVLAEPAEIAVAASQEAERCTFSPGSSSKALA
jgi:hypothetical protein